MTNRYLHIENDIENSYDFNWSDNVFIGSATVAKDKVSDFCREKADEMRNSNLRNYDYLTTEQRERLAKLWESVMNLPVGNYDYYFNLEDKTETFIKSVQELAEKLGIDYELNIKKKSNVRLFKYEILKNKIMIDAIEHIIKFLVMNIFPLTIILWIIGSIFKYLDEKIIELEDRINKLENKKY